MSGLLPSLTLQGHKRLSPQEVIYEFKLLIALKQILTFRLPLEGEKWAFHMLWYLRLRLGQQTAESQWLPPSELGLISH